MALPAIDLFNAAAANLPDAPWHNTRNGVSSLATTGTGDCKAGATSIDCAAYWDADAFTSDHYSEVLLNSALGGNASKYLYLFLRAKNEYSTLDGYWFWTDGGSDTVILRVVGGVSVGLKTYNAFTAGAGDTIRFQVVGANLKILKNGAEETNLSVTDGSPLSGGAPGIGIWNSTDAVRIDSWNGDNIASAVLAQPLPILRPRLSLAQPGIGPILMPMRQGDTAPIVVTAAALSDTGDVPAERPGLQLGTPQAHLRSAPREASQIGMLAALGLSVSMGFAQLDGLSEPVSTPVGKPGIQLGSPTSRLRAAEATDQQGQLSALGLSVTTSSADLFGIVPVSASLAVESPGLGLGTPKARLRATKAADQQGQLAAVGLSVTAGGAQLDGAGALAGLGLSSTVGEGQAAGAGPLAALALSSTASLAQLNGAGAAASLSVSSTVGSGDLQAFSAGATSALGLSSSASLAQLDGPITPVVPSAGGGLLPGKISGDIGKGMGPYKRSGQVFGEQDPPSPALTSRATLPVQTLPVAGRATAVSSESEGAGPAAAVPALTLEEAIALLLAMDASSRGPFDI